MKKLFILFCLLHFFTLSFATSTGDTIFVFDANNPMLDLKKENLRILDIGNSYTDGNMQYLPNIAEAVGATTGYSLYKALRNGATFTQWVNIYNDKDDGESKIGFVIGDRIEGVTEGTAPAGDGSLFREALQNGKWDLILIHQASQYATDFEGWNGSGWNGQLKELIRIIRESNPQATIGFYLVHSYWSGYNRNSEGSSLERWRNIATAIKKIRLYYGIDFIIPYGTAAQNLRKTHLNDGYDFSTDGNHLAGGLGTYVAACCYWQSVFAPRFGDILGNTYRKTNLNENKTGVKNITDETADMAQKAAMLAVKNMYEITDTDSFDIYMQLPAELIYYNNYLIGYNYNKPVGNVVISDGTVAVSRATFNECKEISSVSLPNTIRHIGNYAFKDCDALTNITISVPEEDIFEIDSTVFMNVDKSKVTLYVPYGASDTYASTKGWSEFENIIELPYIFNLEISDCGYSTLYIDYNVRIPENVEVYTANAIEDKYVKLESVINTIPARTAVLVKAAPGKYKFVQTKDEPSFIENNLLKGTLEDKIINTGDGAYYVLANSENGVGFYSPLKNAENSFINNANKAYLFIENEQQSNYYRIDYSSITNIVDVKKDTCNSVFDITGQRVKNPIQGIYIINGKKVIFK